MPAPLMPIQWIPLHGCPSAPSQPPLTLAVVSCLGNTHSLAG
ncbi:hypothetical protein [Sporomusa sp.]|nr:hypothetical protein [Sporomusa sp.]HWR45446.1 hypothetical protein [Sporomusa sp.]